jgi:hypothetical protein
LQKSLQIKILLLPLYRVKVRNLIHTINVKSLKCYGNGKEKHRGIGNYRSKPHS